MGNYLSEVARETGGSERASERERERGVGLGVGGYPIDDVLTNELGESKDKQMYTQAGNA